MKYYAAQVKTTREEIYIEQVKHNLDFRKDMQNFFFLRRKLSVRKGGKTSLQIMPIFPGYIFIEADSIDSQLYNIMRHTPNFYRFLINNENIYPLEGKDLTLLKHFMQFGTIAETSKVWFDDNDRIVVSSGPLSGLEGLIIKVDKRKHRAKVRLDFANNSFTLDLAFEVLEKNSKSTVNNTADNTTCSPGESNNA